MNIRVKILQPLPIRGDCVLKGRIALRVTGASTTTVVGTAGRLILVAIAVDVHVCQGAAGALDVYDSVVLEMVLAVRESCQKKYRKLARTAHMCVLEERQGVGGKVTVRSTIEGIEARRCLIFAFTLSNDTVVQVLNVRRHTYGRADTKQQGGACREGGSEGEGHRDFGNIRRAEMFKAE